MIKTPETPPEKAKDRPSVAVPLERLRSETKESPVRAPVPKEKEPLERDMLAAAERVANKGRQSGETLALEGTFYSANDKTKAAEFNGFAETVMEQNEFIPEGKTEPQKINKGDIAYVGRLRVRTEGRLKGEGVLAVFDKQGNLLGFSD